MGGLFVVLYRTFPRTPFVFCARLPRYACNPAVFVGSYVEDQQSRTSGEVFGRRRFPFVQRFLPSLNNTERLSEKFTRILHPASDEVVAIATHYPLPGRVAPPSKCANRQRQHDQCIDRDEEQDGFHRASSRTRTHLRVSYWSEHRVRDDRSRRRRSRS